MVILKIMTEKQIVTLVKKEVMKKTDYLINELNKERAIRIDMQQTIGNLFNLKKGMMK